MQELILRFPMGHRCVDVVSAAACSILVCEAYVGALTVTKVETGKAAVSVSFIVEV